MSPTIADWQRRLWREMTEGAGVLRDPLPAIEAAFFTVPRHHFGQRFRTWDNPAWRTGELAEIYADDSLILVGDDNAAVVSACSMPSYILALTQWLDVQPGHRVLEIGSGCGWLAAPRPPRRAGRACDRR